MKTDHFINEFVEFVPANIEAGTLYISMEYATAVHLCACGCGNKVVTPFSPTDWKLTFDGRTVSLHPSIGNWSFPCQSHYWIKSSKVQWAPAWNKEQIDHGRTTDHQHRLEHFKEEALREVARAPARRGLFARALTWLKSLFSRVER